MANENWEEISEWEIEEDIDLAQRITVHAVHTIDDDEEYQLVQAYKHPTYAAAAKWGGRKLSSSKDEASKSNKTPSEVKKKSTTSSDEETSKPNKTSSAKKKVLKDEENEDDSLKDIILKGDHDVDYDTSDFTSAPLDTKNRKEARRTNSKLHKVQSHKLMSTLISNTELELNQDLVKGDTNRDPEFKRYKLLKKSMALNKKYTEKSKNDRKGLDKLRVEVW